MKVRNSSVLKKKKKLWKKTIKILKKPLKRRIKWLRQWKLIENMESNKKSIITKNNCISTRTKNPIRIEPKKYVFLGSHI